MKPLPLPVRVAAGLAVTAVDRARHLPEKLAELPVTVVSQALQLSMRMQQQMTELAIKGDDALSTFRPVEETPEWARFDEDDSADAPARPDLRSAFDLAEDEADLDEAETGAATEVPEADVPADIPADAAEADPWAEEEQALAEAGAVNGQPAPAALPNYAELSVPQLRARLRKLTEADLTELVEYERSTANRDEHIGMLTRRIATLRAQQ
ncbi:MAG TPA: lipid droplet-associated protein [Pseudonocardiaceae bacterium]|jgi:hypothetical protein|nr:lipid droplet-associated protein [Pseudonocardiaceae bacterium]